MHSHFLKFWIFKSPDCRKQSLWNSRLLWFQNPPFFLRSQGWQVCKSVPLTSFSVSGTGNFTFFHSDISTNIPYLYAGFSASDRSTVSPQDSYVCQWAQHQAPFAIPEGWVVISIAHLTKMIHTELWCMRCETKLKDLLSWRWKLGEFCQHRGWKD